MRTRTNIKRISIARQDIKDLAEKYGVCVTMVYNALAGRSNSEAAKIIRKSAVEDYGGRVSTIQIF